MSNRYVIANGGTTFFKCSVDAGAILHIDFVAHADKIYIAPNYRIKPNTAVISHQHLTYYRGVGR
jgi:hypothetical protein